MGMYCIFWTTIIYTYVANIITVDTLLHVILGQKYLFFLIISISNSSGPYEYPEVLKHIPLTHRNFAQVL